ncbi:MAG: phospholipase D family protein [Burkholderiaceae bacterium]|nr:phospholipase D family protein [Burkholderiaceae bacterium]
MRSLLLPLILILALSGCGSLPPRGDTPPSQALAAADSAATPLGRLATGQRPAGVPATASGFRLLPSGEFALDARLALIHQAQRTLDLQAYHLHPDASGRSLLRALRDAAARGVRVRLLVDDAHAAEVLPLLAGLALQPQAEVRLFNPLSLRHGPALWRIAASRGEFERNHRRMHNKLLLADGVAAVFGGRNLADEYFMHNAQTNFIDMDLLGLGPVGLALGAVFDRYWNSEQAWPLDRLRALPADAADQAALRAGFDAALGEARPPLPAALRDPLQQAPLSADLALRPGPGTLALAWAEARVHADPPEKAARLEPRREPTEAMAGLLQAMSGARQSVAIVSPYFVPDDAAMAMMAQARRHGVKLILVTNSLASTDEPLVHAAYARRRPALLKLGVEISEIGPALVQRSRQFGSFGRSTPRLHAKVAIVDQRQVLVGSVNLDARSAVGNTEMGLVIDSPALAAQLQQLLSASGGPSTALYRLRLAADGQTIEWLTLDAEGRPGVLGDEPDDDAWQRLLRWLQGLLVEERLL